MIPAEISREGDGWDVFVGDFFIGWYPTFYEAERAGIDASERLEVQES